MNFFYYIPSIHWKLGIVIPHGVTMLTGWDNLYENILCELKVKASILCLIVFDRGC